MTLVPPEGAPSPEVEPLTAGHDDLRSTFGFSDLVSEMTLALTSRPARTLAASMASESWRRARVAKAVSRARLSA